MESGEVRFRGVVSGVDGDLSTIRLYEEFCPGLLGVEDYSHLIVLYWFHGRDTPRHRGTLQVYPRRHQVDRLRGVYACRSPSRPNPVGHTVVELVGVEGCELTVRGLDALEGSPLVDIKPYSPRSDSFPEARTPDWSRQGSPS
jgi:tRNA-Thr(GGU) m(6)t(6)A37 methyltransferase TsaA